MDSKKTFVKILIFLVIVGSLPVYAADLSAVNLIPNVIHYDGMRYRVDSDSKSEVLAYTASDKDAINTLVGFQGRTDDKDAVPVSFLSLGVMKNGKYHQKFLVSGNDYYDRIELKDVDRDGEKEILLWSAGGAHHTDLDIYKYTNGKLSHLFSEGSACEMFADESAGVFRVKIGREKFDDPKWSYAQGTDRFEVWEWNGKKFIYNPKVSTSKLIGRDNAALGYVQRVLGKT